MITETEIPQEVPEKRWRLGYLEAQIGNTPLLRLRRITEQLAPGVEILVKAEHLNPGGSVKDRPALAMILEGERSGRLYPGKVILDATSGNTGIAYAMLGAARGYGVTLCLPANASEERKRILRIHGATIIETDRLQGSDGAQIVAREMANSDGAKYFYADQYNNDANWRAHFETTGPRSNRPKAAAHFVAGRAPAAHSPASAEIEEAESISATDFNEPDSPIHGLEGLKRADLVCRGFSIRRWLMNRSGSLKKPRQ